MQTKYDISVEDVSQVKKKLNITVPAEAVDGEIRAMYQSLRSTASIAGFRKGNIPLNILKARFSDYVKEEVTKKIIESSYMHSLREKGITPIEAPKLELVTKAIEEGKEFSYTMTLEVPPSVEIKDYMGMELVKKPVEVTDKDIEDGLEKVRLSRTEFKEVERAVAAGDLVVVDFDAFLDGTSIPGHKATDYQIIVGELTPLPGFDEGLKGASKGETKDVPITFPENYSEQSLAGKASVFKVTVKAVKEKVTPVLDDEFAKDLGKESLEGLRTWVKDELQKVKETQEKERLKNEVLDRLIDSHPFEVPEAMVTRYLSVILGKVYENMRMGHFEPGDRDLSSDQLKAKYRSMAERSAREDVILDTIAAAEKVDISEEELGKAVRHLAETRGVTYEALMARIEREGALEIIKDGLKHEKVFDKILEASKSA